VPAQVTRITKSGGAWHPRRPDGVWWTWLHSYFAYAARASGSRQSTAVTVSTTPWRPRILVRGSRRITQ